MGNNHFSFGQISNKFYEDQPILIEKKPTGEYIKIREYMDVKANQYESRIVHKVELPSKEPRGKGLNAWELYGG